MITKFLSSVLVTCMIASTVLCGCSVNAIPPADGTGSASADETEQAVSDDDAKPAVYALKETDRVLKDLPTSWDLTDIYADYDAFEADMKRADELLDEVGKFRGTLGSAEGIKDYLESPVNLEVKAIVDKADIYQELLKALNTADPKAQAATTRYKELERKKTIACAFFDTEIMELPFEERQEIISDEMLAPYAYYLRKYTDKDYRILSEEALTAETLMESAANNKNTRSIFDNVELIRPTFTYPDGTEAVLTNAEYNKIMKNPDYDRDFRNEIYSLRNAMRQPYSNTYASLLEGEMRKNITKAKLRGFDTALDHALFENDVDPAVYQRIIEFAHSILPSVNEYYKARAEFAGLDKLSIPDLKLLATDYNPGKITYDDSVNLGRSALSVWGDEYLETFDRIITKPHIDVYPADTKASGAFEGPTRDVSTPYVMYNFDGMTAYTSTIVHEMGHAVYSEFSAKEQNSYNNNPSDFTQEVASTANELMLRKKMINDASSNDEKLYWLGSEIDLFMSALITQCKYSEFEDYCYKVLENGGSLNGDDLNRKWLELSKLYYGDNVQVDDETGIDWARINHFYYDYYVYQYATSLTYAASVCNLVDKNGQDEVDDYISFLKAGNSASPADLLRIANVDPMDDKTYEEAGALIKELIEEYISAISNVNYTEKQASVYYDTLTYEQFKQMTQEEQEQTFADLTGSQIYALVENSDESWPVTNYDLITPENAKETIVLYNNQGDMHFNLAWPPYGGFLPESIGSIRELSGVLDVSRDGGDSGHSMSYGKNADGSYPNDSERSVPKSSATVRTGVLDVDRYNKVLDIVASGEDDDSRLKALVEMGYDSDIAGRFVEDHAAFSSRDEVSGPNNINEGALSAGHTVESKYGYYGTTAPWDAGDLHLKGGAGQLCTVLSWGTLCDSGLIYDTGTAEIH